MCSFCVSGKFMLSPERWDVLCKKVSVLDPYREYGVEVVGSFNGYVVFLDGEKVWTDRWYDKVERV